MFWSKKNEVNKEAKDETSAGIANNLLEIVRKKEWSDLVLGANLRTALLCRIGSIELYATYHQGSRALLAIQLQNLAKKKGADEVKTEILKWAYEHLVSLDMCAAELRKIEVAYCFTGNRAV